MSFSGLFQTQGMLCLLLLIEHIFGKKGLADGTGKNLMTDPDPDCLYDHCYCGDRNTDRKLCSWNVSL